MIAIPDPADSEDEERRSVPTPELERRLIAAMLRLSDSQRRLICRALTGVHFSGHSTNAIMLALQFAPQVSPETFRELCRTSRIDPAAVDAILAIDPSGLVPSLDAGELFARFRVEFATSVAERLLASAQANELPFALLTDASAALARMVHQTSSSFALLCDSEVAGLRV